MKRFSMYIMAGVLTIGLLAACGGKKDEAFPKVPKKEEGARQEVTGDFDTAKAEDTFKSAGCISCHGADLSGGGGPNLQKVGSKYDAKTIEGFIQNGKGGVMPAGLVEDAAARANLAKWLEAHK